MLGQMMVIYKLQKMEENPGEKSIFKKMIGLPKTFVNDIKADIHDKNTNIVHLIIINLRFQPYIYIAGENKGSTWKKELLVISCIIHYGG